MKVVGFHNQCPIVEFQYRYVYTHLENTQQATQMYYSIVLVLCTLYYIRRGQMLNVRGEKVSEALFLDALKKAVSQWPGAQLVDYCCAESGIMGNFSHNIGSLVRFSRSC